jgi:hypothetical protein
MIDAVAKTFQGDCGLVASPALFPDIRVEIRGDSSQSKADCSERVQKFLAEFQVEPELIKKAISRVVLSKRMSLENPAGDMIEAENIIKIALANIYDVQTVMHGLMTVDLNAFETSTVESMNQWLLSNALSNSLVLRRLVFCEGDAKRAAVSKSGIPYSNIIAPQSFNISLPRLGSGTGRLLQHVVIVGADDRPEYAELNSAMSQKYCGRERSISLDPGRDVVRVRVRCLTQIEQNNDTWVVMFCDPRDCSSPDLAEKVAAAVAADPDTIGLARSAARHDQQRGPYLVSVLDSGR